MKAVQTMDPDNCLQGAFDDNRLCHALKDVVDDSLSTRMAATFKALADPTRVRIISALLHTELCVGDLASCLGMSISAISHQLRLLREMRLVRHRREGKHVFYTLDDDHIYDLFQRGLEHASHD
jgi:DNA-binding transcriptional ArsR family regulator